MRVHGRTALLYTLLYSLLTGPAGAQDRKVDGADLAAAAAMARTDSLLCVQAPSRAVVRCPTGAVLGLIGPADLPVTHDSTKADSTQLTAEIKRALAVEAGLLPGPMQTEAIANGNPGLSRTYLGGPTFPQPNRLPFSGHLQITGNLGSWGSQTNALTVAPNAPLANAGNQGGFWDPAYRTAYDGQDQAAVYVWMQARAPVLQGAAVSSFGTSQIATQLGNRTVYTLTLATPLTSAQIAAIAALPPNLRLETGGGFYGYLIPPGFISPSGASVAPVSADGLTLVVDNWVRAHPSAIPSSAGALPSAYDAQPWTVSVDLTHQVDDSYGGWRVADTDAVRVAMGDERVFINAKSIIPAVNLYDPLTTNLLTTGSFYGVVDDLGRIGQGVAGYIATEGWQVGFVARNMPTSPAAGGAATFGFLAPYAGPTWGFYSTQGPGSYAIAVDPGNSCGPGPSATPGKPCTRTYLLDTTGNTSQTGAMAAAAVNTTSLHVTGTARVDGTLGIRTPDGSGQSAYIDGPTGQIVTSGFIVPGSFTMSSLPGCTSAYPGAHIFVADARKPGEAAGAGSGAPADCVPLVKGGAPVWASVYDHAAVVQ